jgi:hypothetical protein
MRGVGAGGRQEQEEEVDRHTPAQIQLINQSTQIEYLIIDTWECTTDGPRTQTWICPLFRLPIPTALPNTKL